MKVKTAEDIWTASSLNKQKKTRISRDRLPLLSPHLRDSGDILLAKLIRILGFGIRNTAQGILTTGIQNPRLSWIHLQGANQLFGVNFT